MREKLHTLNRIAQISIGTRPGGDTTNTEVFSLIIRYNPIEYQVGRFVETLRRLVGRTEKGNYIFFIPGINYLSTAALLAEPPKYRNNKVDESKESVSVQLTYLLYEFM